MTEEWKMKLNGLTANAIRLGHIFVALAFLAAPMVAQQDASVQANIPAPAHYVVIDLGTLGGSFSLAYGINDNGQIDGFSTLPGDNVVHSFLYNHGAMTDLGTLGGPNSQSFANLNNATQVAGYAETSISDPNG